MLEWDILNYLKKWRTNLRATQNGLNDDPGITLKAFGGDFISRFKVEHVFDQLQVGWSENKFHAVF